MIFSRRALQSRLDDLRMQFADDVADGLAARLNRPGKDRLAAMWEVVVLQAFAGLGELRHERELTSGRRPDIDFEGPVVSFVADVTTVSDEGLDETNPYFELSQALEQVKTRLGLPIGGLDLQVHSLEEVTARGSRRLLRLPPRPRIQEFVQATIKPLLQTQIAEGAEVLRIAFDDEDVGVDITIDPRRSPYSTGGYAAYASPTIKDRNPLYGALKAKAGQLRGAPGYTGIIVGDAHSASLRPNAFDRRTITSGEIAREFLRQHSSVDFVLLLTISEEQQRFGTDRPTRWIDPLLVVRDDDARAPSLQELALEAIARMPTPIRMPINAALRAREPGYDLGFHGGYSMNARTIRISSRELVEILAGKRTLADNGAKHVEKARALGRSQPNHAQAAFDRNLREGRLPDIIQVIKAGENEEDDWIEFRFGEPDPAISTFR